MLTNVLFTKPGNKIQCSFQCDCIRNIGSTRFKFVWKIIVGSFCKGYFLDHLSSALERRHLLKQSFLPIQYSCSCGSVNLMTRKSEEIAVKVLNIDVKVNGRLGTIEQNEST